MTASTFKKRFSVILIGAFAITANAESLSEMPEKHRALFKEHCHQCHNADKKKGKFRVDDLPFTISDIESAERWQKVLDALNSGEMPPEDEEPLPNDAKTDFLDDLSNLMVSTRKKLSDQKGVITMRRLNRREYSNTLRELLGVEINVSELPSDTGSGNFDTVGSNLFISANQFQQYLDLGRKALDEAFEWHLAAAAEEAATEKRIERFEGEVISEEVAEHIAWQTDAQERATKWAAAVEAAAAKPENAEIVAEVRKKSKDDNIFRRFWAEIPGAPSPESFGFESKENSSDKANQALRSYHLPYHNYYAEQPAIDTGMYLAMSNEHPSVLNNATFDFIFPWSWPIGDYVIRVRAAVTGDGSPDRRFIEFGVNPRNAQAKKSYEVTGTMEAPEIIEIPFTFTSGHKERLDRTLFIREKGVFDHYLQTRVLANKGREENDGIGRKFALWIDYIEIERLPESDGPLPKGIAAIDVPLDDKSPAPELEKVRGTLNRFATGAFRGREPSAKYLDGLMRKYETRLKSGEKPATALKDTLAVVLSSPMFLYLAEPNLESKPRPLSPQELATRLSYFIWGSPPDEALLALAASGELAKPEVLRKETTRLLDDPRSEDLVHSFTYQWLGLDRLDFFQVDVVKHPRFHNTTKAAARDEIYETMKHLMRENDSVTNLLKSDYAILDATLAEYYGIEGVTGSEFRKVSLPEGSPRGGLLGMAAVSLMGGNGDETNPVERGTWVLRKLLNDPPPPAPANIPQIARLAGQVLTTDERLLAHQEEAQCASCHRKIDPIGLGLENFDAVGAWRTEDTFIVKDDNGKPVKDKQKTWQIDPAGALYKGPEFKDYLELRDIIAGRKADFAHGFTEAMSEYALGRPIGFSDEFLIEEIVEKAESENFAMRSFVHAIVHSKEFQSK
ncbi:MAG: DUF1592 domain-containing protein [Verrucomicrobiales bacterium]|nr:DUF1592 domain-containing protein [Verrucomicrobiales bacterium]